MLKKILSIVAVATVALVAVLAICRYAGGEEGHETVGETLSVTPEPTIVEPEPFDLEARAAAIRLEERVRHERERDEVFDVLDAIDELQPYFASGRSDSTKRRRVAQKQRLANAIVEAAREHGIDPLIAVAMARRESSLHPLVGHGKRNGSLGERGYFQIYPNGYAERTCGLADGARCDQYDERCNARTALCYLAKLRDECGDDPWFYVGGYGRTRCPSDRAEAQEWPEVVTARDFYCEIADCAGGWPM